MPKPTNTFSCSWGSTWPTSPAKAGESHAWNLAWLDGIPCWIDPTWGDPVFTGGDESQGPAYEYFGLTSDDLTRTHTIDSTVPVPDCTANTNNYFVRSGLYFPSYDATALVSTLQRAMAAGEAQVSVRFADDAYVTACASLLDGGELSNVFQQAAQRGWRRGRAPLLPVVHPQRRDGGYSPSCCPRKRDSLPDDGSPAG